MKLSYLVITIALSHTARGYNWPSRSLGSPLLSLYSQLELFQYQLPCCLSHADYSQPTKEMVVSLTSQPLKN